MTDFAPAHTYFSHALVSVSNSYSVAFSDVRNSSVNDIKAFRQSQADSTNIEQTKLVLSGLDNNLQQINSSVSSIAAVRSAIEGLLTQTPSTTIDAHADLFKDESDSDKQDGWDDIGSDEEIIG